MWLVQLLGGIFCVIMGVFKDSLSTTIIMLFLFSFFIEAACGATYGVVPFVASMSRNAPNRFSPDPSATRLPAGAARPSTALILCRTCWAIASTC